MKNPKLIQFLKKKKKVLEIHALKLHVSHLEQNRYVNVSWKGNAGICVRSD